MNRIFAPFLAVAVFVLVFPVSVAASSTESDYGYPGRARAELLPLDPGPVESPRAPDTVAVPATAPVRVPRPPVRTVVPATPNPDLPDGGVTWVRAWSPEPEPAPVVEQVQAVAVPAQAGQEVSIRVIVTIGGEDHVIEIPAVTVGAIVQAIAAPVPTPVAPALAPVALTPAPSRVAPPPAAPVPVFQRPPAVMTPRMPAADGPGVYRVQVGSFARTALAQSCFDRLTTAGFRPAFERFGSMYRVVIPGVRAVEMTEVAQRLGNAGFGEAWLRREN